MSSFNTSDPLRNDKWHRTKLFILLLSSSIWSTEFQVKSQYQTLNFQLAIHNQKKMKRTTLNFPTKATISADEIYIADTCNHRVRKLLITGQLVTIAGTRLPTHHPSHTTTTKTNTTTDQLATQTPISSPSHVLVSPRNEVFIS